MITSPDALALEIVGLHHSYAVEPVLVDVNLSVAPGESVALLGPSGCGKTTLLRSIAGLERPASGSIRLGHNEVFGDGHWVAPERRGVGMVFQDWALFPHLSVRKNVAYGLARSDRAGPRVEEALGLVGLDGFSDRMPDTLSGGQQQRIALARALAPRPSVLLLDEPFSNLDSSMRTEVRTEVHRLLHELEITAVFVTHDQEEAFVLGDRVAVMARGQIIQIDTPQNLYARPTNRWVAEFVGTASILACDAADRTAHSAIGDVPLDAPLSGPIDLLLRPEQLAITEGDQATVELVEFYGHDAMVFVSLDGHSVQVRAEPGVTVKRGDRVGLVFVGAEARGFPVTQLHRSSLTDHY